MKSFFFAKVSHLWYKLLQTGIRLFGILLFRIRIFGRENIPLSGPFLVAANHQSVLDPLLVGMGITQPVHYMARRELFGFLPLRWLLLSVRVFPVDRDQLDLRAIRRALSVLRQEQALVVFPEGTRTRDGQIGRMRRGLEMLARRAEAPVVPALVRGAFDCLPRAARKIRFRPIEVHFLAPIPPEELSRAEHPGDAVRQRLVDHEAALGVLRPLGSRR